MPSLTGPLGATAAVFCVGKKTGCEFRPMNSRHWLSNVARREAAHKQPRPRALTHGRAAQPG
eukprot:14409367-Alexandrium_andersonii.AAC.1